MLLLLELYLLSCLYVSNVHMSVEVLNVYFSSENFHTMLHWDAVCDDVEQPCTYKVRYKVYGDEDWTNKTDCWGTQNFCNMTTETLQSQHVEDRIMAQVRASAGNKTSRWMKSKLFLPIRDTNMSVPAVSLSPSANSIVVYITTPPLLYLIMYPEKKQKKVFFNIAISNMSKLLHTVATDQNVWEIKHLPPGHYCISVKMTFNEKTSNPSPNVCVNLNDLTTTEVILGSAITICVSLVIAGIIVAYLIVYRRVLHPKAHLPSNLIFNDVKTKSSPSEYKSDETFLAPSIFEGMELGKHTQETNYNEEHSRDKRYVMTETWRKGYVNFRQKYIDPNVPLNRTVELRNSTYGTNAVDACLLEYPSISPEARYTKTQICFHYGQVCNEYDYYNDRTDWEKSGQPYFNQEEKFQHFYVNDQFQTYGNIPGKHFT